MRKIICLITIPLFLNACNESAGINTKTNDRFDLCMRLPADGGYVKGKESIDFSLDALTLSRHKYDVYVGHQPPFQGKVDITNAVENRFDLIGMKRTEAETIILLGRKKQGKGLLTVMFTGKPNSKNEAIILSNNFVSFCDEVAL
jgi:hypothetical protein